VICHWEADPTVFGDTYGWVHVNGGPIAYRTSDTNPQTIGVVVKGYRLLPNGARQLVYSSGETRETAVNFEPADFNRGLDQYGLGYVLDNGSKLLLALEIRWHNSSDQIVATAEILFTQYISEAGGHPNTPVKNSCDPFLPATAKLGVSEGNVNSSIPFTIKPRIKLIPSSGLKRGDTVNVSLRGFAANETVRIRWKNSSGSRVPVAQVVTSNTGSANVNIKVPSFAVIGANSVRGDGNKGAAAQTNAITVVSGSASSAAVKASPSPSAIATGTPTIVPATSTPEPTATATRSAPMATPEVATETPSPTIEPTEPVDPTVEASPAGP
jgi:hypothetical protein